MFHIHDTKQPIMVIFDLPEDWPVALAAAIPEQRRMVNRMLAEGVIQSYSVSADRTKVWMVLVIEKSEQAVEDTLAGFPILAFATYRWEPLLLTNDSSSVMHYSLN
jgi:hypothetical protein